MLTLLLNALTTMGHDVFHSATGLRKVVFEAGFANIGYAAFAGCSGLAELDFPESVSGIGDYAFENCTNVSSITFAGDAPAFGSMVFRNITAPAYYPTDAYWPSGARQNYGGTITWQKYGTGVPGRVDLADTELADETTVWVDGVSYPVQEDASGNAYVDLPEEGGSTMVSYGYHEDTSGDVHTQYPVSMKVWALEQQDDGSYAARRVEELDNILQYSGMSIRITGKKGIRMITSIDRSKKNDLVSDDLAGYSLKEYGTVVAWADQLSEENPLVLGKSYAMSNYAYKKGVADPVYHYTDNLMQYTNVLVNFDNEQCKQEIAMRSYMILENEAGQEVTLYGGVLYRSIGYIAYQNRGEFDPGTEAYEYIWNIIHYVYGDAYDADYREA